MRRYRGTTILLAATALIVTACSSSGGGSGGGSPAGGASPSTGMVATSPPSGVSGGGASNASIVAQNFSFSPSDVTVASGKVTLTVSNKDSTKHTFTLDDGSSSTDLTPGKTVTIALNLTQTVGWHCQIHHTMTGTLTVA